MSHPTQFVASASEQKLESCRAFDGLAESYDAQLNPLLALEQRYLERLLPHLDDRNVLDVGCGSGRWLTALSQKRPRGLIGLDLSTHMLEVARQKKLHGVELLHRSCTDTRLPGRSVDLILSSFVLSHIGDLRRAAAEFTRIARPGCDLFVSDMHPGTQHRLGWKRTFRDGSGVVEFESFPRDPNRIAALFGELGWDLSVAVEAEFGPLEEPIFRAANRLTSFREAQGHPAIYLLHLRKDDSARFVGSEAMLLLKGARCALGGEESVPASVRVLDGTIAQILGNEYSSCESSGQEIDLTGYRLMPGLVNAHDHLEFALFPRLGNPPYANATAWANDVQRNFASIISKHKGVAKEARLWWGAIRNLLCGVTTVCHHNLAELELERADFPVRVVQSCGWAHSISFGGDLCSAKAATPPGRPFILHACEGTDRASYAELGELDSLNLLDKHCVLVHGLALDENGVDLMRRRGTALVLCPSSNRYLFGVVPEISRLEPIRNLALGSDSPLTAAGDFLDEIRFVISNCGIAPDRAYRLATDTPASVLRLTAGEGSMRAEARADLIVIRDAPRSPAHALGTLSAADIELVLVGGQVQLASPEMLNRLPASVSNGLELLWFNGSLRWLRAPIRQLLEQAERVLGVGSVRLGGKPIRMATQEEAAHAC